MTQVFRSPAAERDLEDIWLTIAADNPAAATRVVQAIGQKIGRLADHPRLGPRRPDIRPTARLLIEGSYLILYETHPDVDDRPVDEIEIVRVVDGRRDLTRPF
ncbi:Plasmid stabilization protein [Methylocella tundrae]|uniref:Plasmid stabilization protein n=1 Tax=Methylocella tundrae TaxID=227605 RepID=A0A8B6MA22_METTU|nr:type II toxin-antitoxin system RelE/ParE family toxin [Methylocella tundrae]VTZ21627.1 Plasmid stabilization protein [Methylocella tundrae]VTZ51601.1 Plasmid stabilization protein [Methylocella tundrae]